MARTVDPVKHEQRRLAIIDAGLTCFAADGYDRATTASICREAGIGSGTFFHYFPTKLGLLLAILDLGTVEEQRWWGRQAERDDPRAVLDDFVRHIAADASDPRMPGFIRAVGAIMGDPDVAAALARDEAVQLGGLRGWVAKAQESGQVRADLPADRLAQWVYVVTDGYLARLGEGFPGAREAALLPEMVARMLAPETTTAG